MLTSEWNRRHFLACTAAATFATPASARIGNAYAMFSPEALLRLPQMRDKPVGQKIIKDSAALISHVPKPLYFFSIEGRLPGDKRYDQSVQSVKDFSIALTLALGAVLTGDKARADAVNRILLAWLRIYKPGYNPINETQFDSLILAWDLIGSARSPYEKATMNLWTRLVNGYIRNIPGWGNWNSHRVKLMTLCAFATGDTALINAARKAYQDQVLNSIYADGEVTDFKERDALAYVVYGLDPLLIAAYAAKRHGEDWWGFDGGRLSRAVAWLKPYADGTKTHEEFKNSKYYFDKRKQNAGIPNMSGLFDKRRAGGVMALAARFDSRYKPLAGSIPWLDLLEPL